MIVWTSPQVGDFAILLRAGFDRWSAAKLQLSTALGGLLGACFAICAQSPKGVGTGMGVVAVRRGAPAEGHGRPDPGIQARLCPGPPHGGEWGVAVGTRGHLAPPASQGSSPCCRGDGGLDPALHLRRLSLHCPGERAARPPGRRRPVVSCPPALPLAGPCPLPAGPRGRLSPGPLPPQALPAAGASALHGHHGDGAVLRLRGVTVPGAPPLHSNKRLGFTL